VMTWQALIHQSRGLGEIVVESHDTCDSAASTASTAPAAAATATANITAAATIKVERCRLTPG